MLDLASVDTPRNRLLSVLLLAGLLVSWEVVIRVFGIAPFILPAPSAVAQALWRGFANGPFLQHTLITVAEVLLGFIFGSAVGLVLGVGIALNRHIAYFVYPYIVMFLSMPKVALAPLIVSKSQPGSCSSRSSTPQVKAEKVPPPCKASDSLRGGHVRGGGGSVAVAIVSANVRSGISAALVSDITAAWVAAMIISATTGANSLGSDADSATQA